MQEFYTPAANLMSTQICPAKEWPHAMTVCALEGGRAQECVCVCVGGGGVGCYQSKVFCVPNDLLKVVNTFDDMP
jgi:hypothetical protein